MDEDTIIIDQRTRNEKIKNFFIDNKRSLISLLIVFIIVVISFYSYQIYKDKLYCWAAQFIKYPVKPDGPILTTNFLCGFSPPKTVRQRLRSHEWMATGMSAALSTPLRCDDSLASNYAGTLVLTAARPHCKPSLLDGVLLQALRHLASQHRGSAPMR